MLHHITLKNVGPASEMDFGPLSPRLNAITGDNGLGKSFLLELAWWALTRTWHEHPANPTTPDAQITATFDSETKEHRLDARWNPEAQDWKRPAGKPPNPGLVLYMRVDGSFSVWDPMRNYRQYQEGGRKGETLPAYQFGPRQVWDGLEDEHKKPVCAGLIKHWVRWQESRDPHFDVLTVILARLSPPATPDEPHTLRPGAIAYPRPDEDWGIPTIKMPYGQEVPLTWAPAGVQKVCQLAYLLTWSLMQHERESKRLGRPPSRQMILLIDEPETHLHPRWQRTILPSLLRSLDPLRESSWAPEFQLLVTTHSPLVLASLEPLFDEEQDALWKLDLVKGQVVLERDRWHRRGDASAWLTSDVFDLVRSGSLEAERALERAMALLRRPSAEQTVAEIEEISRELAGVLSDTDRFWVRWSAFAEERGVTV